MTCADEAQEPLYAPEVVLRLECLRLALGTQRGDHVDQAREFFEFVTGREPCAPRPLSDAPAGQADAR